MKTQAIIIIIFLFVLAIVAYAFFNYSQDQVRDYKERLKDLERVNDSIGLVALNLKNEADSLSIELQKANINLDKTKREVVVIEKKYKNEIARLKDKTPVEIQTVFEEVYPRDLTSPAYSITTNQAGLAVETYYEKEMAEELLENARDQITQLERIIVVKSKEVDNRDTQIGLLEFKLTETKKYYLQAIEDCADENKKLKKKQLIERLGFAGALVITAILILT
jgi:hypothetical protein